MAKFATAYITLEPDLSAFGAGLGKEIEARLSGVTDNVTRDIDRDLRPKFAGLGKSLAEAVGSNPNLEHAVRQAVSALDDVKVKPKDVDLNIRKAQAEAAALRATLADLGRQVATPEVKAQTAEAKAKLDEIKVKLAHLSAQKAEIKVDVDRGALNAVRGVADNFGTAFQGLAVSIGGLLGIGGAITGFGQAAAAALPLVAALAVGIGILVASFGAAVAGAGALAIALAGVLGPAAAVAFAVVAKIATIIKAIHSDSQGAAAAVSGVANAQDQVKSATEGLAAAQDNLRQQGVAAAQAMSDAFENVKDDVLAVQDAELGIADSQLALKEARLELEKFKKTVPDLEGAFKKFTDVDVDISGLRGTLRKLGKQGLSEEDQVKLERLILNVRRAKLGEKHATDQLHDSNVKLARDRQTEAKYVKQGIAAYPGYASAVRGVASAERSLASARRAATDAATKEAGAVGKLSPLEQRLAGTFKLVSGAFNKAFGPAVDAVFRGLNRSLGIFVDLLGDRKIRRALRLVGQAIGDSFVVLAKTLSSPAMRRAFITLTNGAARLVKLLGTRVFKDVLTILVNIAVDALPALVGLFSDLADTLDRWAKWIKKNPKELRRHIVDLVNTFLGWLGVIIDIGGFLVDLGGKLKSLGDTIGGVFRGLKDDVSSLIGDTGKLSDNVSNLNTKNLPPLTQEPTKKSHDFLGFDAKDLDAFNAAFGRLALATRRILDPLKTAFADVFGGMADIFRGFVQTIAGLISGKWAEAWRGLKSIVVGTLRGVLGILELMVAPFRTLGKRLGEVFGGAFRKAISGLKAFAKSVLSAVIDIVRKGIKFINDLTPGAIKVHGHTIVPGIPDIPVPDNPFNKKPKLNTGHLPTLTKNPPKIRASASSAGGGQTIEHVDINVTTPAGATPDGRFMAAQAARELARRGGS